MLLALADNLRTEGCLGALAQVLVVVFSHVDFLLDLLQLFHGDFTGSVEAVCNLEGVDTLIEELLGLF